MGARIYYCAVVMVCISLGNSLESTRNQSPSKERFNFFDAELVQVFSEKEAGNVVVSPLSVKLVLGMLLEGAGGGTAEELAAALRLPLAEEERRKEFDTWLSVLQVRGPPNVLKLANRMFLSRRYAVSADYEKALRDVYGGGVTGVEFEDPREASRTINEWVSEQTSQLISGIVQEGQIHSDHKLLLTSAVYFKGIWSRPFAAERTALRCFYPADGKCQDALMMADTGVFHFGYIPRLDAKAVSLPYKGGDFTMLVLLPSRKGRIDLLGRDLAHVGLGSVLSEMKEQEVFVQIPQFEISYNENLADDLRKVHVSHMFGPSANLSRMLENRLESIGVSSVYHSAKITVNEEGSEAAAATGALFVPLMGGTTTSFVANRPFFFFVVSPATDAVLFAGRVTAPMVSSRKAPPPSSHYHLTPQKPNDFLRGNSLPPTKTPENPSDDAPPPLESLQKLFHEAKQRGQSPGPKFRSIKPLFSPSRAPSGKDRGTDSPKKLPNSFLRPQKDAPTPKKGKTPPEMFRTHKRQQESGPDDWRHHVLFFT